VERSDNVAAGQLLFAIDNPELVKQAPHGEYRTGRNFLDSVAIDAVMLYQMQYIDRGGRWLSQFARCNC
jgi:hypothetical protein